MGVFFIVVLQFTDGYYSNFIVQINCMIEELPHRTAFSFLKTFMEHASY